ncbi:MAG: DUF4346 domain-containing protein [Nanoarchaeota archaeon]
MKLKPIIYPKKIKYVEVNGDYDKYNLDKKSFLLIRVKNKKIEVGVCDYDCKLIKAYRGSNVKALYKKIIDDGWISEMKHAAYLGMELQRAFECMKTGKKYVQEAA